MRSIRECANGVSFLANFAVKSFFTAKNAKIAAKNAKKI